MLIVGSANGDAKGYLETIKSSRSYHSVLLGNAGLKRNYDFLLDYPLDALHHHILMGSEDYYPYKDYAPFVLPDFGIIEYGNKKIGFIRGEKHKDDDCNRVIYNPLQEEEDYSDLCFPTQEQLTEYHFMHITSLFLKEGVKIILTVDIPQSLYEQTTGLWRSTHTRRQLDNILFDVQPSLWIFNNNDSLNIEGKTKFIGLSPLQTTVIKPYE
jgi:hypothetical protein